MANPAASSLVDTFDADLDPAKWRTYEPVGPDDVTVSGGACVIQSQGGYPALVSVGLFDLTVGGGVSCHLLDLPISGVDGAEIGLALNPKGADYGDTRLQAFVYQNGAPGIGLRYVTFGDYGANANYGGVPGGGTSGLWFRVRWVADGSTYGAVVMGYSLDGVTFDERATFVSPVPLTAVEIALNAGNYNGGAPQGFRFADVNLDPSTLPHVSTGTASARALASAVTLRRSTTTATATARATATRTSIHRTTRTGTATARAASSAASIHRATRTSTASALARSTSSSTRTSTSSSTALARAAASWSAASIRTAASTASARATSSSAAASSRTSTGEAVARAAASADTSATRGPRLTSATAVAWASASSSTSSARTSSGAGTAHAALGASTTARRTSTGAGTARAVLGAVAASWRAVEHVASARVLAVAAVRGGGPARDLAVAVELVDRRLRARLDLDARVVEFAVRYAATIEEDHVIEGSREFVTVRVWLSDATGAPVALDGATASIRFDAGAWLDATLTAPTTPGDPFAASILVGPGTAVGALGAGSHAVYVRITDSAEAPVLRAGNLYVERAA